MKKILFCILSFQLLSQAFAAGTCRSSNEYHHTRIARDAVRVVHLVNNNPEIRLIKGGVSEYGQDYMVVDILTQYADSHDLYKVKVRLSDCRIIALQLHDENVPNNKMIN